MPPPSAETPLKILAIHQGAELYGSDKIFLESVTSLARVHAVDVILDSDGPLRSLIEQSGARLVNIEDVAVLRRKRLQNPLAFASYLASGMKSYARLLRLQRREGYDVFYVNTLAILFPLFVAKSYSKLRAVHHIHEIQTSPAILFKTLYSLSLYLADRVIVVSTAANENFVNMAAGRSDVVAKKLTTVRNGIPDIVVTDTTLAPTNQYLTDRTPDCSIRIAMIGRLHSWKGQLELIEALALLKKRFDDFVVVFFGSTHAGYEPYEQKLRQRITEAGLEQQTHLAGQRTDSVELLSSVDFSLMPSVLPDPFPTVVLESLMQGTPVIGYAHGGVCEMIEHESEGLLVQPCNSQAFADAMYRLCTDGHLRERLSRNARFKFLEAFSSERYHAELRGIFDRLALRGADSF